MKEKLQSIKHELQKAAYGENMSAAQHIQALAKPMIELLDLIIAEAPEDEPEITAWPVEELSVAEVRERYPKNDLPAGVEPKVEHICLNAGSDGTLPGAKGEDADLDQQPEQPTE